MLLQHSLSLTILLLQTLNPKSCNNTTMMQEQHQRTMSPVQLTGQDWQAHPLKLVEDRTVPGLKTAIVTSSSNFCFLFRNPRCTLPYYQSESGFPIPSSFRAPETSLFRYYVTAKRLNSLLGLAGDPSLVFSPSSGSSWRWQKGWWRSERTRHGKLLQMRHVSRRM